MSLFLLSGIFGDGERFFCERVRYARALKKDVLADRDICIYKNMSSESCMTGEEHERLERARSTFSELEGKAAPLWRSFRKALCEGGECRDIVEKHVMSKLNGTDIKFFYEVNAETRALIKRSSRYRLWSLRGRIDRCGRIIWTKYTSAMKLLERMNSSRKSSAQVRYTQMFTVPPRQRLPVTRRLAIRARNVARSSTRRVKSIPRFVFCKTLAGHLLARERKK